jgi:hypothetical protein
MYHYFAAVAIFCITYFSIRTYQINNLFVGIFLSKNEEWKSNTMLVLIILKYDGLRPHKISHDCLRPHTYVMIVWGHTKYISCSLNLFALKISSAYRKFCKTAFLCAFSKCSFPCYFLLLYDFSNKRIMGCSEEIK